MINEKPTLNRSVTSLNAEDRILFDSLFKAANLRGVSSGNPTHNILCSMIEIPSAWNWNTESVSEFIRLVTEFNQKSKLSIIEIIEFSDAEVEYDRDRTYPAYVMFNVLNK